MLLFSSFLEWKEIQPCQKFSDSLEILSHFKAQGSLHTAQVIISHSFEFAILKEQFVKKKKKRLFSHSVSLLVDGKSDEVS